MELEGKSYKLVKVGMSKQRSRGKFRRMYVYKDRINMKHMSRSAIINDIKNWYVSSCNDAPLVVVNY